MLAKLKPYWEKVLIGWGLCILLSFCFSAIRLGFKDHAVPCAPLFIDKLEPWISTRWFCEMDKK